MRTMYDSTKPHLVPIEADIIACYPNRYGVLDTRWQRQMVVLIDDTGEQSETCHILDLTAESARNVNGLEWVTRWYITHRNGMGCLNGWIQRPVIKVMAPAARAIRVACMPYDIDVWAVDTDEGDLPVPGCFARQFVSEGQRPEPYGVSRVYNDEWGKMADPPKPSPLEIAWSNRPLRGLLVRVVDGCLQQEEVSSYDRGDTWQS